MINKEDRTRQPEGGSPTLPLWPRVVGGKLRMPAELQAIHR